MSCKYYSIPNFSQQSRLFFKTLILALQNPAHRERGAHHQNPPETNTGRNKTTCNLSATNPTKYKEKDFTVR